MTPQKIDEHESSSEQQTQQLAARLADLTFEARPVFIQLSGPLGAGKSAFARGFIRRWAERAGEPLDESVVSPTYNIVKVYGTRVPVAHLDLYRLKSLAELEQFGFEQYFYETPCCLVEWFEQIPEAQSLRPPNSFIVELSPGKSLDQRKIRIRNPSASS